MTAKLRPARSRILGTGMSVPEQVRTNADLEKMVETSDAWIRERSGIEERRILEPGRVTSDLATAAVRAACTKAELDPAQLDCIIVATITPDLLLPSCAVIVQHKLGIKAAAFDIAAACAGFVYALSIGDAFVASGQFKRVAVVGVEVLSRITDWTDRNTCVLFGDGAGAVILGPTDDPERGVISTHLYSDGSTMPILNIPAGGNALPTSAATIEQHGHCIKMNGREVYKHAVRNLAECSRVAMESNGLTVADIDLVVAHQANLRIVEGVAQWLGAPMSAFHINIQKYGNTSSASIPIALDEAVREGKVKPKDTLLFCALGAGLSWGSAIVRF